MSKKRKNFKKVVPIAAMLGLALVLILMTTIDYCSDWDLVCGAQISILTLLLYAGAIVLFVAAIMKIIGIEPKSIVGRR
jgi:hypothetical protein